MKKRSLQPARQLHRLSAMILSAFALLHLANHLVALAGAQTHINFMSFLREIYRTPLTEPLLLASVLIQVASGIRMLWRSRATKPRGFARAQRYAGVYLAFFLLAHTSAVLIGRLYLRLDTNFYFSAATLTLAPLYLFFVPYYGLAVISLFVHLAAALRMALARHPRRDALARGFVAVGALVALLIILAGVGAIYPITLPPDIQSAYAWATVR